MRLFNETTFEIMKIYQHACLAMLLIALFGGCSGPEDPTIPVWGKVTVNGAPVKHGDIEFGGKENSGLRRGAMIIDGKYRTAPMQGLLPGNYVVRIFSVPAQTTEPTDSDSLPGDEELGAAASRDVIPPAYNMRSKLTVTVTEEGPNEFNFDIDTTKK
jgi:hypothetical protein